MRFGLREEGEGAAARSVGAARRAAWRLWAPKTVRAVSDERGQATAEYAMVLAGVLCVIVACGFLWRALQSGLFVDHALMSASHHVQMAALGAVADVFSY